MSGQSHLLTDRRTIPARLFPQMPHHGSDGSKSAGLGRKHGCLWDRSDVWSEGSGCDRTLSRGGGRFLTCTATSNGLPNYVGDALFREL